MEELPSRATDYITWFLPGVFLVLVGSPMCCPNQQYTSNNVVSGSYELFQRSILKTLHKKCLNGTYKARQLPTDTSHVSDPVWLGFQGASQKTTKHYMDLFEVAVDPSAKSGSLVVGPLWKIHRGSIKKLESKDPKIQSTSVARCREHKGPKNVWLQQALLIKNLGWGGALQEY